MIYKFKVIKPIVLGFLTPQDSYDRLIDMYEVIEYDDVLRAFFYNGKESHTASNAVKIWLDNKFIEEIK